MRRTKEQKALDEELFRECEGYYKDYDKPDGAYIEVDNYFFNINKIKRLIDSGADVRAKGYRDYTPLHRAAGGNNIDLAKLLIASGADVRAKDLDGDTPLHWAVDDRSIKMAKLLIKAGADVNAENMGGYTPLGKMVDYRSTYRKYFDREFANALIEAGAKF